MKVKIRKIENLQEFIRSTKTSKSTIYRFYKKNEELFTETIMKSNKRFYPEEHIRYFNSEIMFEENKVLRIENQSMKNLIECLADKNSFPARLWHMDWTFFYTVAYKSDRNKKSCYRMMNAMYDELIKEFGENTEIRLFFTTEVFPNRIGCHNHLVVYVKNESLKDEVINAIDTFFSYDKVQAKDYDKLKAGLFYVAKSGLHLEDWDILGNNLSDKEVVNEN